MNFVFFLLRLARKSCSVF